MVVSYHEAKAPAIKESERCDTNIFDVLSLCFVGGLCFATGMKLIDILFKVEQKHVITIKTDGFRVDGNFYEKVYSSPLRPQIGTSSIYQNAVNSPNLSHAPTF